MSRKILLAAFAAAIILPLTVSCSIDPSDRDYISTATLKNCDDGTYYYKETEITALIPDNPGQTPVPGFKEKRMLITYTGTGKAPEKKIPGFENTFLVHIKTRTPVLTKATEPSYGDEEADKKNYGNDPVTLYFYGEGTSPYSTLEDGYLCIRAEYVQDPNSGFKHNLHLVTGANPDDPWEVELRHQGFGDSKGDDQNVYLVFPLNKLPDTKGETKTLTLVWNNGMTSEKLKAKFNFCTRTDWPDVFPYDLE